MLLDVGHFLFAYVGQVEEGVATYLTVLKVEAPDARLPSLHTPLPLAECLLGGVEGAADHAQKDQVLLGIRDFLHVEPTEVEHGDNYAIAVVMGLALSWMVGARLLAGPGG